MVTAIKPGWSRPTAILFASEVPVNEKAFGFALAEAAEFSAELFLFHAYDSPGAPVLLDSGIRCEYRNCEAERQRLEPLAQRAARLGVRCKVVVRPGLPAEQILRFVREQGVDRVVIGNHTPGPVGKLLVGSVAEEVLRNASAPVIIFGSEVVEGAYRHFSSRTILCSVGALDSGRMVVQFAAELAAHYNASLILQHVTPPQDAAEALAGRTLSQIEAGLSAMVPPGLQHKVNVRSRAVLGDATEELLYQGRSQRANLIVIGAQGVSRFAAITRAGIVYKVLAYAQCPVITLSPVVLSLWGARCDQPRPSELCMAGVF